MTTSPLALPRIVCVDPRALPPNWRKFFAEKQIRLNVVILYENDAGNGKRWPAEEILTQGVARGDHGIADTALDSSSGNYAVGLAVAVKRKNEIDPNFPIKRVVMVVTRSIPPGKEALLRAHRIELIYADDPVHAMVVAEAVAKERGYWYTCQYRNKDNPRGYARVADYIAEKHPWLGMVGGGVGSGGWCSGIYPKLTERFKDRETAFVRVAVVVEDGQKVGGVRDEKSLEPGSLDWRTPIDDVRFIAEDPSYKFSAALWGQENPSSKGICLGGPSTGFAAEGVALAARRLSIMHRLNELRHDGWVDILIPSLDTREPYRTEYANRGIYWNSET
jgi:cysteine synthase